MRQRIVILFIIILSSTHINYAQEQGWTLEKCISYALENNLELTSGRYDLISSKQVYNDSKYNLMPTLNSTLTHGYNWGQSIDPFTNEFANSRVRTDNLYLSSDWLLFSGMQKYHLRKRNENEYQYQQYNLEVLMRNLKVDITAQYLQVLMTYQLKQIAIEQLNYSQKEVKRISTLVNLEASSPRDAFRIRAQLQADSLELVKADNQLTISILQLKQSLNLNNSKAFHINLKSETQDLFTKPLLSSDILLDNLPEMKQVNLESSIALYQLKEAKGARYPSIYLSGSLGSGYSGNNLELVNGVYSAKSFGNQLKENFYQSLTMTFSIPIFNNREVSNNVALARLNYQKSEIKKKQIYWELLSKIEQTRVEVFNAQSEIKSASQALESAKSSFQATQLLYKAGKIDFIEYLEDRNTLFKAQVEFDKSKIQYFFKVKILGYYQSKE